MAAQPQIRPERVTKPIQLLAAWLVGLIIVNGAFLTGAVMIAKPAWAPAWLVVAAIINVPVFIAAIFVLQTRFRPEMQEDVFYSQYLESKTGTVRSFDLAANLGAVREEMAASRSETLEVVAGIRSELERLTTEVSALSDDAGQSVDILGRIGSIQRAVEDSKSKLRQAERAIDWSRITVSVNDYLPNYDAILTGLKDLGVRIDDVFGSSSDPPRPPGAFVLSLGDGLKLEQIRALVDLLEPSGLKVIEYDDDDMYCYEATIGSYAVPGMGTAYVLVDSDFLSTLRDPGTTSETLVEYLKSNDLSA